MEKNSNDIYDFCLKEQEKLGDYNSLTDEYEQGYWIAMNTVLKEIESYNI